MLFHYVRHFTKKRQGSKEARKNEHPTLNAEHRTSNKRKAFILVLETLLALKT